jgi:hypothetical protein
MEVLYTSCRRNFNDPFIIGDCNLYRDELGHTLTEDEAMYKLKGRRVLLLEHGYRSEVGQRWFHKPLNYFREKVLGHPPVVYPTLYSSVLDGIRKYGVSDHYDYALCGLWPGGELKSQYPESVLVAKHSAPHVTDLLHKLADNFCVLDIQAHSLGAHLVLAALQPDSAHVNFPVRNLILIAPAVNSKSLNADQDYGMAVCRNVKHTSVCYSHNDTVLKYFFPIGEAMTGHFGEALGYKGLSIGGASDIPAMGVLAYDCTRFIDGHSAYKASPPFHALWLEWLGAAA